jgi:flagellin
MSVINTNVAATLTANSMRENQRTMENTMERLATGKRINSASDDAAGLAIETRMDSQIRGLSQAARNANDGISMLQTADGAASEMTNMLQRMRELSVQASTGTLGADDRANLNQEFAALATEIDRIATDTTFNDKNVLASTQTINITVGADQADTIAIKMADFNLAAGSGGGIATAKVISFSDLTGDAHAAGLTGLTTFVANSKTVSLNMSSAGLNSVDDMVIAINNDVNFGASAPASYTASKGESGELLMTANTLGASPLALSGTLTEVVKTAGVDATTATTTAQVYSTAIGTNANADTVASGTATKFEYGSNSVTVTGGTTGTDEIDEWVTLINAGTGFGSNALGGYTASKDATHGLILTANTKGSNFTPLTVTTDDTALTGLGTVSTLTAGNTDAGNPMGADISSFKTAGTGDDVGSAGVIAKIDAAIKGIATARAGFGAAVNRLEYTVDNLNTTIVNTQAAKSQIVDADYAAETTELARTQIIAQASTAMLSQANQAAQSVLALLK